MNRRLIGLVTCSGALAASVAGLTLLYACSGDDNSTTTPPVNDSGASSSGGSSSSGSSSGGSSSSGSSSGSTSDGGVGCSSLPGSIVYIESGDTQEPILDEVGREMRDNANVTLVFLLTGSCTLTPNVFNQTAIPAGTQMLYIPSTAENPNWKTSDPENTCTVTAPVAPNLGISALFTSSCGITAPSGVGTFLGPIQAYTFAVPSAEFTTQTSISAEEAYYAIGDGANNPVTFGGAAEWNIPSQFFLRPAAKSTMISTALNIGLTVPEATLAEADGGTADGRNLVPSSGGVITDLKAAGTDTPLQALGILGDEVYDPIRGTGINILAFQGFGQTAAYYPDSTLTSFDKQNIRDGHYTLWSPTDYIALVDNTNTPTNATVKYVLDVMTGAQNATPPNGYVDGGTPINGLDAVIGADLTPYCAMQVARPADGAPLTPYTPTNPCTCYFLSKVAGDNPDAGVSVPASCGTQGACNTTSCPAPGTCSNGFCEVPPAVTNDGGSLSIENAPTTATAIVKAGVAYPDDGGLQPLNP